MPDEDYVEGLTGEEIINDMLEQVGSKLRGDCNLRDMDSYPGGYDGWVEVHLNLHALDTSEVRTKITIGIPQDDPEQKTVDAKVEIPLEPHVNLVRERSGQDVPTLTKGENGQPVVKKRHYAKRQAAA